MIKPKVNLIGQKFGKLTPIKYIGKTKDGHFLWLCECDCGNEKIIRGGNLKNKQTKSCGCIVREKNNNFKHGNSKVGKKSKTYIAWANMLRRCTNPNNKQFKDYGGRGITVCLRWSNKENGFQNFLEDMGECPPGLSLDRINNNQLMGGYSLENCRWETNTQQHRNKRNNRMIPFNNGFLCLKDYCKIKHLNYKTILSRIDTYGWSIEEALKIPVKQYKKGTI